MVDIPFIDLRAQYNSIRTDLDAAIARVLESGKYVLGEEVAAFEQEFAAFCGTRFAIGVGSGTTALQIALMACEIGQGDEVITASHTSVATVAAIELTGARPVLVDIDLTRYTISPVRVSEAFTPNTKAIIPVHLYGCPADLAPLQGIARRNHLFLIEDCAQAHGALYKGRHVGSLGNLGAFSFYPTKNLGAQGDGGMVVTNDPNLAGRVRLLRQYGWEERYISKIKGLNSRLDELQAGILRVKLKHLVDWNARRRTLADLYSRCLAELDLALPLQPEDSVHVFHQYVIRHERREELKAYLKERGVQTLIHYPVPIHLQPAYRELGLHPGELASSELASRQVLSLPLYPEMAEESVKRVCEEIKGYFKN